MQLDVQELNMACGMTAPLNENSQRSGNIGTQAELQLCQATE